jgi:type IV pilus assembly protein PilC
MTLRQAVGHRPETDDPGLSAVELRDFFLQLSVMTSSGVPLLTSLEVLSRAGYQRLGFVAEHLCRSISRGHTLSGSFKQMRHSFDLVIVSLVAVGEKTGKLDLVLRELAKRVDARHRNRQRIVSALTYPAMVVVVSLGLIALLCNSMLPVLLNLVQGMNVELPWPTRMLLLVVKGKWIWALLLGFFIFFLADLTWGLREETSGFRNWILYRSPGLGQLNSQRVMLELCNDLALMLSAGCLLTQALASLAPTSPDPKVGEVLLKVRNDIQNGDSLDEALARYPLIPQVVSGSLALGMEVGRQDSLLRTIASLLEADLESRVDRLTALIEPFTMAALGLVVGGILLASLLPIYSVVSDGF